MRSQAEEYARRYDGKPLLSQREISESIEGNDASRDEVYDAADEIIDFYDTILDVDTSQVREEFKDDILYDLSIKDILRPRADKQSALIFSSGAVASFFTAFVEPSMTGEVLVGSTAACQYFNSKANWKNAEAGYNPFSQKIGVSRSTTPKAEAYDVLASEILHRYQHHFESDTWMDINRENEVDELTEGLERSMKIKALENFDTQNYESENWRELHDMRKASTAINGYAQALSEIKEAETSDLTEIGLTEESASETVNNIDSGESRGYDLIASYLLAVEEIKPDIFCETFHGNFDHFPEFMDI